MADTRTQQAITLMEAFAERTGLSAERPAARYLWTDAFALCNFIGLERLTGDSRYIDLALELIDQVHHTLGRHREDDPRLGWISGLDETEGNSHPTRGGLRIGKRLPERGADEPYYERLEWDRDGQYFHYLTKWMHALNQASRATGEPRYNLWARELAEAGYRGFTYTPATGRPRMYWKMSIDLERPLVPSMGQHDPLDGLVTARELSETASLLAEPIEGPILEQAIDTFAAMLEQSDLTTADPLGLGGLLVDAYRLQQLQHDGGSSDEELLRALLAASLSGLQYYARSGELHGPAEQRLAFRELGLAIGLHALRRIWETSEEGRSVRPEIRGQLHALMHFAPMAEHIEAFWLASDNQRAANWQEHRDINEVMLATSLAPTGFLELEEITVAGE